jgi:predicted nucleotidyltransferase
MIEDLEAIFKRNVDLITQKGLERSTNAARQKRILESARVIHAA